MAQSEHPQFPDESTSADDPEAFDRGNIGESLAITLDHLDGTLERHAIVTLTAALITQGWDPDEARAKAEHLWWHLP